MEHIEISKSRGTIQGFKNPKRLKSRLLHFVANWIHRISRFILLSQSQFFRTTFIPNIHLPYFIEIWKVRRTFKKSKNGLKLPKHLIRFKDRNMIHHWPALSTAREWSIKMKFSFLVDHFLDRISFSPVLSTGEASFIRFAFSFHALYIILHLYVCSVSR